MDIVNPWQDTFRESPTYSPEGSLPFPAPTLIMHRRDCTIIIAVLALLPALMCGCVSHQAMDDSGVVVPTTHPPDAGQADLHDDGAGIAFEETTTPTPLPFVPGGTYRKGDMILLGGTTILSPGNHILVEVSPVSFGPTKKGDRSDSSGTSGVVSVAPGDADSRNTWAFLIDTRGWEPDEYMVHITGIEVPRFTLSSRFTVHDENLAPSTGL